MPGPVAEMAPVAQAGGYDVGARRYGPARGPGTVAGSGAVAGTVPGLHNELC
jgi:hypothetical protein